MKASEALLGTASISAGASKIELMPATLLAWLAALSEIAIVQEGPAQVAEEQTNTVRSASQASSDHVVLVSMWQLP